MMSEATPSATKPDPGGWYYHPFEMAFSGYSGAGKTTLVEKLVRHYQGGGRKVAFLKRDAHFFEIDRQGKDTYRAADAGAVVVAVEDKTHSAIILDHGPQGPSRSILQQSVAGADIVFIEGRKHSPLPKIVLLDPRNEVDQELSSGAMERVAGVVYRRGDEARARGCRDLYVEAAGLEPEEVPVVERDDVERIVAILDRLWLSRVPPVTGLVMVGGQSTRMGRDKCAIETHQGVSAARRAVDLLSDVCDRVCISARPDQRLPADVVSVPRVDDRFLDFGPVGGILTALYREPRTAWLVVGCDLPLLTTQDLQYLLSRRDPFKVATAFAVGDGDNLRPEPLCAVWEPRSRGRILSFLQEGAGRPRWILRNGAVHLVEPENPNATYNANTPADLAAAGVEGSAQ
ncbi:MAG: molybdopterin-guanine dinucleotide biosynthesis protein B [Alkalispirochaeta sp.]